MIAKRVTKKRPAGFKSLAAYVVGARDGGRGSPVDWNLGGYVLDDAHAGEKVAWAHATNCHSDDLGIAVAEIMATQDRNRTARTDKSYHLVVSFPVGERPTREQMIDIERELCASIGMGEHQRVAAVHQNTDNWHMHVAINRVHPTTLRAIEPHRDYFKLQEACIELEIKHGLTVEPHTPSPDKVHAKANDMEAHTGRMSFARWVAEHAAAPLTARAAEAKTWADLHMAMADYGLVIKPRGAGLIVSNADGKVRMKASDISRDLSFKALTDRLGAYEAPAQPMGKPSMQYTGMPRGADASLWERYQAERQRAEEARSAALETLRVSHLKYGRELIAWHKQRYLNLKAQTLSRANRLSSLRTLDTSRKADHAKRRALEIEQRNAVKAKHVLPTWDGFLARSAGVGDRIAQAVLERRVDAQIRADVSAGRSERESQGGRC